MLDGGARVLHQLIVLEPVSANVGGSAIGELDSVYQRGLLGGWLTLVLRSRACQAAAPLSNTAIFSL